MTEAVTEEKTAGLHFFVINLSVNSRPSSTRRNPELLLNRAADIGANVDGHRPFLS